MKIKKYLYKYSQNNGTSNYIIYVKNTYVASRRTLEEITPIYEECKNNKFYEPLMKKIKQKYAKKKHHKKHPNSIYIYQNQNGTYFIQKGKQYFCSSDSYETIQEYKKQLEKNGWNKDALTYNHRQKHNLPRYIQYAKNNTYRIRYNGGHYGIFKTIDEAVNERDLLIKNNWEYDFIDLY